MNKYLIQKPIDKFSDKTGLDIQHRRPLKKAVSIILYLIIFFIILGIFGLFEVLWGLLTVAGFAGIVIGMATRDVISDMLIGFFLYIYRPFKIGDSVEIGDIGGIVKDIGVGGVQIKAWSGEIVFIPNTLVRTSIVKNFTIDSRRATITFFVDFASDFSKTLEICKKTLDEIPEVMKSPAPVIRVDDLTENSVKILVLVWFSIDEFWIALAKVQKNLAGAFKRNELNIPVLRTEERNKEV
ncbi:hypothetical protein AC481_02080 [miscellaneous Crenarchaeota group archaeon SMTZ-80]|nr:MAG: hypothetical protein AC481_02080 [miscellaneous Crenarchaeota group archaeon SMTZ-80]